MAASAQLLLTALSKPTVPGPTADGHGSQDGADGREPDLLAGVPYPDAGLDGAGSATGMETPLTSEPPLATELPLTSEPPLAAGLPLTSEPTAAVRDPGAGH
ncbi:hypothetical protein IHE55_08720 [Streptomyces pactum]|uniref:Uncharacterized protein n=1 Tax=Streptomyces pactum TaxID=68249 RepID=A0ABS0NI52_9ACTN|nr:hypothetical protein [Streptomyces pactum]MBH5334870.1 hypothetical protein [Streptomyces pactum]